jgi:hypothetical protein
MQNERSPMRCRVLMISPVLNDRQASAGDMAFAIRNLPWLSMAPGKSKPGSGSRK